MAIDHQAPGLATTVQDLGRPGYYNIGIPLSGGMDRFALRAANMLVGNEEGAAVLEAVFMGPEVEFTDDRRVAVTGAELPPKVDGQAQPTWTCFTVRKGQVLSFDYLKTGARAYIAVSGGVDVPRGARQPLHLSAGRPWRARRPKTAGGRQACARPRRPSGETRPVGARSSAAGARDFGRAANAAWTLLASNYRGLGIAFFRGHMESRTRSRPNRLPVQRWPQAGIRSSRGSRLARDPIHPISWMHAIPMDRYRYLEAPNRSSCIAMPFPGEGT